MGQPPTPLTSTTIITLTVCREGVTSLIYNAYDIHKLVGSIRQNPHDAEHTQQ